MRAELNCFYAILVLIIWIETVYNKLSALIGILIPQQSRHLKMCRFDRGYASEEFIETLNRRGNQAYRA